MAPMLSLLIGVGLQTLFAGALPAKDLVESLPGWEGELFSKTYSGYISAGEEDGKKMYEHYLFFESEGDPAKDPVLMWTNGGPGASSFFGAFAELGPYYLSDASLGTAKYNSSGVPTLFRNPYSWTKLGSLIIRNLPPPVGFSYCDPPGPSGDGYSCGSWNDTKTAKHSHTFMKNWMEAFPEFAQQDLYLLGESYAGIYVPTLAREILADTSSGLSKQLKGFAVGDGVGDGGGPWTEVEFFHGHGTISEKTYNLIREQCPYDTLVTGNNITAGCKAGLDKMDDEKGYNFAYNLYDECYDFDLSMPKWDFPRPLWRTLPRSRTSSPAKRESPALGADFYEEHHMDGYPCGATTALSKWVHRAEVKHALHVAPDAYFFDGDNGEGFEYNSTEPSLFPFYQHVALNTSVRVLIYSGDADPGAMLTAQNYTQALGLTERESWRPWTEDGKIRMGGYVTRYAHDVDFVSIRGSGHMVPQFKPRAAMAFLKAWLAREDYPHLKKQPPASITNFANTLV